MIKIEESNLSRNIFTIFSLLISFILFVPLYQSYNDQYTQIYFFCIAAVFLGGVLIIRNIMIPMSLFRINFVDIIVLTLVTYVILYTSIFNTDFDFVLRVFSAAIIYFFIRALRGKERKFNILFNVFLFYGIAEVCIVMLELCKIYTIYPDSIHVINGTFGNPNVVAIFLALLIPVSIYQFKNVLKIRYLYAALILLFIVLIILSKCRSAIIFTIFSIAAFTFQGFNKVDARRLVLIATIILSLSLAFVYLSTEKEDSNISRRLIWKVALGMIEERPFSGLGFSNFEKEYNLHQRVYLKREPVTTKEIHTAGFIRQPYNEFLYCWLTGGIFFLMIYLILFVLSIFYLVKSFKNEGNSFVFTSAVSLVGMFLISLFSYTFYVTAIEVFLFFHLAILAWHNKQIKEVKIRRNIYPFILIAIILFVGINSSEKIISDFQISKASNNQLFKVGDQVETFEKHYLTNCKNPQFLFNYALVLIKAKRFEEAILKLSLAKQYSSYYQIFYVQGVCYNFINEYVNAEKNYLIASELCPSLFQPNYALFKLYQRQNNDDKTKKIAVKIKKMKIKHNSIEARRIKSEIGMYLESLK